MGDFFEIEEMVSGRQEIAGAIKHIKGTAAELGLQLWDKQVFKKISEQSWVGIKPEPLMKNQSLHPLIIKALTDNNFIEPKHKTML